MTRIDGNSQNASSLIFQAVQERVHRFARLRSAQRALSRVVPVDDLREANRRGREVLIHLQELTARTRRDHDGDTRSARQVSQVDRLLSEISERTRNTLASLNFANLRATVSQRSDHSIAECQGLIDVLLEGDLECDQNHRILEFLVTFLSTEERDGRRVRVREPSHLTPRLREICQFKLETADNDELHAERALTNAAMTLHNATDVTGIRERMRSVKETVGSGVFHPRVLLAIVTYNVAMWNRVNELIEGGDAIDELAVELFGEVLEEAVSDRASVDPQTSAEAPRLDRPAFDRIVDAVRARVAGQSLGTTPAERIATACDVAGLRPAEVEVFGPVDDEPLSHLIRSAITLRLVVDKAQQCRKPLKRLQMDLTALVAFSAELSDEISAAARKCFSESRYDEAFHLSQIKTRNLVSLRKTTPAAAANPQAPATGRRARSGWDLGLPPVRLAAILVIVSLPLLALMIPMPDIPRLPFGRDKITDVSPFLESGYAIKRGARTEFIGRLNGAWAYLDPHQRLRVTAEIGMALKDRDIFQIILKDRFGRIHARYRDGPQLVKVDRLGGPPRRASEGASSTP